MVNWTKKAEKAASGILQPGEHVVAGVNLTAQQFQVVGGGATGGFIAGGLVGALVGRVWDQRLEAKRSEGEAARDRAAIEDLPVRDVGFPSGGAVAAVTDRRVILFEASAMGTPQGVFYEVAVNDIDGIYERELEQRLLLGTPASRVILLVFQDETALPLYALSSGVSRKWVDGFVAALRRSVVPA